MQIKKIISVLVFTSIATISFNSHPSLSKEYTIYARQQQLMQDVNKAQKSKQLTAKEAAKMRKKLASVARKKKKILRKSNSTTLSNSNKIVLEKDLNNISLEIKKLMLQKRVNALKNKS